VLNRRRIAVLLLIQTPSRPPTERCRASSPSCERRKSRAAARRRSERRRSFLCERRRRRRIQSAMREQL